MSFFVRFRSNVACGLLALLAFEAGCRVWIEKPLQPDTSLGVGRHRLVRVITNGGDTLTMIAVGFTKDSIFGQDLRIDRRVAIARDDVQVVEVRMDGTPGWVRIGWKLYLGVLFALFLALGVVSMQLLIAE